MLTKDDLKDIQKLLKQELHPLEERLDVNTASVMKIEADIGMALELREDVSQVRKQVSNHEERISHLEKF